MEKKSKKFILFMVCIIFLIIIIGTVVKVYKNHMNNSFLVVEKKITETAKDCFLDGICKGDSTTLGFLVQNGYLELPVNPETKEYLNEDVTIEYKDDKCSINIR